MLNGAGDGIDYRDTRIRQEEARSHAPFFLSMTASHHSLEKERNEGSEAEKARAELS